MQQSNLWVKVPKPNPDASMRLFCLPYAGGGTMPFRTWADHLPPQIEVCLVQLPGREARFRESPFTNITPLVQTLAQVLDPYLDLPFALFGHSMGSLICFELARQLRAWQKPSPLHLFVSGRRAPQIPDRDPLMYTLPEGEFLQKLRQLNGTPKQVLESAELMQLFLPVLRADFAILGSYVYLEERPFDFPISAFGGLEDTIEPFNLLEYWNKQTCSSFSLQLFPGDHFFLNTNQQSLLENVGRLVLQTQPS
jgi:medium-chain acyl-[acyl-carrier-protein] hydrolase